MSGGVWRKIKKSIQTDRPERLCKQPKQKPLITPTEEIKIADLHFGSGAIDLAKDALIRACKQSSRPETSRRAAVDILKHQSDLTLHTTPEADKNIKITITTVSDTVDKSTKNNGNAKKR